MQTLNKLVWEYQTTHDYRSFMLVENYFFLIAEPSVTTFSLSVPNIVFTILTPVYSTVLATYLLSLFIERDVFHF